MNLLVLTVSSALVSLITGAARDMESTNPGVIAVQVRDTTSPVPSCLRADMDWADMVVIDLMGAHPSWLPALGTLLDTYQGDVIPVGAHFIEKMRLGQFGVPAAMSTAPWAAMMAASRKRTDGVRDDRANFRQIVGYLTGLGPTDGINLLRFLASTYGGHPDVAAAAPPSVVPGAHIRDLDGTCHAVLDEHPAWAKPSDKPLMAVLYYGHSYPTDNTPAVRAVVKKASAWARVIPVACSGDAPAIVADLRQIFADHHPDVVVNFMVFRLGAGPMGGDEEGGVDLLADWDGLFIHPIVLSRCSEEQWRQSSDGLSPTESIVGLVLPEMDSTTFMTPVATMGPRRHDTDFDIDVTEVAVLPERIDRLDAQMRRWVRLRQLANEDKRVALVCYDYPPGESSAFSAAFLDTLESVAAITRRLADEGYRCDPIKGTDLKTQVMARGILNSARYSIPDDDVPTYPISSYRRRMRTASYDRIVERWGDPHDAIMTTPDGQFVIPAIERGNILIGFQPSRGDHENPEQCLHDNTLPPHHQYAAFYQWLDQEWHADVVVHVGTHGTLEFLPGKQAAISEDCFGDVLLGDMPHVYLYYCGNPSEAVIARRRTNAMLVSYAPPVFDETGLHGEYAELASDLADLDRARASSPHTVSGLEDRILAKAAKLNLPDSTEAIEAEINRMQTSLVPMGLHTFGTPWNHEEVSTYVRGVRRHGFPTDLSDEDLTNRAAADHEMDSLVHVLDGGYSRARQGGNIFNDPEVLPVGGNLHQFDARRVPTAVAVERGQQMADQLLQKYLDDHGEYPSQIGVVLWGLETSRTQGETYAQILSLLGVRPLPRRMPGKPAWQIIDTAELGRPRIDVVVTMCGFFRDMFVNLVEELDDITTALAQLDEPDELNPIAAHSRELATRLQSGGMGAPEAEELSRARLFGPSPTDYGTSLTSIVETNSWGADGDLAEIYARRMNHVYTRTHHGDAAPELFDVHLGQVELVTQARSNHEYEISDLDHYYEFIGGLMSGVERTRGRRPQAVICDTVDPTIHVDDIEDSAVRGLRTRALNPAWIDAMLSHDQHGGDEIAKRFTNVLGLAATAKAVPEWAIDAMHECYIDDLAVRERLRANNPAALMSVVTSLLTMQRRSYWHPDQSRIQELTDLLIDLDADLEDGPHGNNQTQGEHQ